MSQIIRSNSQAADRNPKQQSKETNYSDIATQATQSRNIPKKTAIAEKNRDSRRCTPPKRETCSNTLKVPDPRVLTAMSTRSLRLWRNQIPHSKGRR